MIQGRILRVMAVTVSVWATASIASATPAQEAVPGEYLVKVKNAAVFQTNAALKMFNAEKIRTVSKEQKIFLVKKNILETADAAIAELKAQPNVEIAEPNLIYRINRTPNDPKLVDLWGLKNTGITGRAGIDISAERAWDIETGSKNVIVAVIDTGIDYTHPDLKDNVWTNEAELNGKAGVDDDNNGYVDDIHGYDFANKDGDPMDDHGHGTHCSGTIGAKGDDGAGIVGVNWNVKIMGVKFLTGQGSGTLEDAILAIDYATKMGAMIESNSWGGGGYTELLKQAIERARDKNVVFVAAAGNDGSNTDENPAYPASYDTENIISVAALDNAGQLAYFSNYGKTTVDVAAPGVDVTSSVPLAINPAGYDTWSGTSMATPHVSGIAALVKAHFPEMSYADIKARIMSSARTLGAIRSKVGSGGMANAYYALSGETPPQDLEDPYNWATKDGAQSSAHPYANKATQDFVVKVDGAKQVAVYFDKFDTEAGYDTVEFKDSTGKVVGKWSGKHDGEFSPSVAGDTIYMTLTADDSVSGYGFDITKAAYR